MSRLRLNHDLHGVAVLAVGADVQLGGAGVGEGGELRFHQVETDVARRQRGARHLERRSIEKDFHGRNHRRRIFERGQHPGGPVGLNPTQAGDQNLHAPVGMGGIARIERQVAVGIEQSRGAIA